MPISAFAAGVLQDLQMKGLSEDQLRALESLVSELTAEGTRLEDINAAAQKMLSDSVHA